jgi:hypothetical protein
LLTTDGCAHALTQTLEQFVQDTEDLVNTSLDTQRNRIISVDIVLTAFGTALGISTAITGARVVTACASCNTTSGQRLLVNQHGPKVDCEVAIQCYKLLAGV